MPFCTTEGAEAKVELSPANNRGLTNGVLIPPRET